MATITTVMVQEVWRELFSGVGGDKADMKSGTLPDRIKIKAILQAIEDRWDGDKLNYKAAMDTAAGVTLTNPQAKVFGKYWLQLKARRGNV